MHMTIPAMPATPLRSAPHRRDESEDWQSRAERLLRAEAAPGAAMRAAFRRNREISAAYAAISLRAPETFRWAGMAAFASSTVGFGMLAMAGMGRARLSALVGLFSAESLALFDALSRGNRVVYTDIYWQHLAYEEGGIRQLEASARAGRIGPVILAAWRQIDAGRRAGDDGLIWAGNAALLRHEQEGVLQTVVYDENPRLWRHASGWIPSPIPGHLETFGDYLPGGDVANFAQRWAWIEGSILPRWRRLCDTQPVRARRELERLAGRELSVRRSAFKVV